MEKDNSLIFLDEETDFTGEIEASNIILYGKVNGTVRAKQSIRLKSGSYMEGKVFTKEFFPEKGSVYKGKLHITSTNSDQKKDSLSVSEVETKRNNIRSGLQKFFSMLSSWAF